VEITVYGKSPSLEVFEVFKRRANGSIEPVSSEELAKLKLRAAAESAMVEDVVGRIEKSIESHSTAEEVVDDLKKQAEELEKSQTNKPDANKK
jgi:hypothetical protein